MGDRGAAPRLMKPLRNSWVASLASICLRHTRYLDQPTILPPLSLLLFFFFLQDQFGVDWALMMQDFEMLKHDFDPCPDQRSRLRLPHSFVHRFLPAQKEAKPIHV